MKGIRDHKHKIMDRPFMPKYGTVSQVLLQLVVAHTLNLPLIMTAKTLFHLDPW